MIRHLLITIAAWCVRCATWRSETSHVGFSVDGWDIRITMLPTFTLEDYRTAMLCRELAPEPKKKGTSDVGRSRPATNAGRKPAHAHHS